MNRTQNAPHSDYPSVFFNFSIYPDIEYHSAILPLLIYVSPARSLNAVTVG